MTNFPSSWATKREFEEGRALEFRRRVGFEDGHQGLAGRNEIFFAALLASEVEQRLKLLEQFVLIRGGGGSVADAGRG